MNKYLNYYALAAGLATIIDVVVAIPIELVSSSLWSGPM